MVQTPAKGLVFLFALGLCLGEGSISFAQNGNPSFDIFRGYFDLIGLSLKFRALYEQGKYQEAIPLAEKRVDLTERTLGAEHIATAASLNDLAVLYQAMGDYAKAEPLCQKVLQINQKVLGPDHADTAASLNNLAELYHNMGAYDKAEPLFQQALQICQKVLGPDHANTATTFDNLASLYEDIGDYAKAEPLYRQALQIRQKALGPEHPDTATSLNDLALLYVVTGDYAKAEPLYQQALQIRQKALGPSHPDTARSLSNLAELYQHTGAHGKAEPLLEQALQIRQKALGPEHPDTAGSLHNLGFLYFLMGDYDKAEPLLEQAFQIWTKVLGPEHPNTALGLQDRWMLKINRGQVLEAKTFAQQSARARLAMLAKVLAFTSEQQRLAYQDTLHPYALFAALDGSDAELAAAVLCYKGVVLDSLIEDRLTAVTSKTSQDRERLERLAADKRQLGQMLLESPQRPVKERDQKVEALEQEVERLEGELAQNVAGLGRARRALSISVGQVQAVVPKDGALIEYVRYEHYLGKDSFEPHYGAVVLAAAGDPLWVPLGSAEALENRVASYQKSAQGRTDENTLKTDLRELYDRLWLPVERVLPPPCRRVILSPDGALNFVSFATLLDSESHFLAERYDLQYVASGRDLLREVPQPLSDRPTAVVFANPDFFRAQSLPSAPAAEEGSVAVAAARGSLRGTEKRDLEDLIFDPLPGTQQECDRLKEAFAGWHWPTETFTGPEASKAALRQVHSPYVLHLATHGFFRPTTPSGTPSLQLAALSVERNATRSKFFQNPMHRSGLVLAGGQSTLNAWRGGGNATPVDDNGIVTAEDVSTLDLKGTWLVTLSACDTGSGQAKAGEGVLGLRRGFVQAGAQNLLMTLWPINDQVTIQIMSDFYQAVHQGDNAAQALAKVQRDWLVALRDGKDQRCEKVKAALRPGLAAAVRFAGPFILSAQGNP
jgi:CHAT domain-containing protein/Tfp pilus assembly protein PilF